MDLKHKLIDEFFESNPHTVESVKLSNRLGDLEEEFLKNFDKEQFKKYNEISELVSDIKIIKVEMFFDYVWEFAKKIYK